MVKEMLLKVHFYKIVHIDSILRSHEMILVP